MCEEKCEEICVELGSSFLNKECLFVKYDEERPFKTKLGFKCGTYFLMDKRFKGDLNLKDLSYPERQEEYLKWLKKNNSAVLSFDKPRILVLGTSGFDSKAEFKLVQFNSKEPYSVLVNKSKFPFYRLTQERGYIHYLVTVPIEEKIIRVANEFGKDMQIKV